MKFIGSCILRSVYALLSLLLLPTAFSFRSEFFIRGTHRCAVLLQQKWNVPKLSSDDRPTNDDKKRDKSISSEVFSRDEVVRRLLSVNQHSDDDKDENQVQIDRRNLIINLSTAGLLAACAVSLAELYVSSVYTPVGFQRFPSMQFIAALGEPNANQGYFDPQSTQSAWGLWMQDPGPRGVWIRDYNKLVANDSKASAGWTFDSHDWWLDEHGIIMENPKFPLQPGRYLVTGGRSVTTGLTIDANGKWKLDDQHTLFDVTHLPCRSARYRPDQGGSPRTANLADFPVKAGAEMPNVEGCKKQDYSVLLLVGKSVE